MVYSHNYDMYKSRLGITNRTKKHPIVWAALVAILLIGAGSGIYVYKRHNASTGPTPAQIESAKKQDQQTKQQTADKVHNTESDGSYGSSSYGSGSYGSKGTTSGGGTSGSTTITATINRANQLQSGAPLSVRATVSGTTSGTCQITLSKTGQTSFTKTFAVTLESNAYTCGQADIAMSDFAVSGDWQVELVIINGSSQSSPVTAQATIQK